jgi:hypothetical protein
MISQIFQAPDILAFIADIQGDGLKIFRQNRRDFMASIFQAGSKAEPHVCALP